MPVRLSVWDVANCEILGVSETNKLPQLPWSMVGIYLPRECYAVWAIKNNQNIQSSQVFRGRKVIVKKHVPEIALLVAYPGWFEIP